MSLPLTIRCKRCRAECLITTHFSNQDNTYVELQCTCPKCNKTSHTFIKCEEKLIIRSD